MGVLGTNKMGAVGDIGLLNFFEEGFGGAVIGTGDDQVDVGVVLRDDLESVGEVIEAFFIMEAAKEEDVGLTLEFGVGVEESALRG